MGTQQQAPTIADQLASALRSRRTGHADGSTCDAFDPCADCRADRAVVQEARALSRVPRQRGVSA